METHTIVVGSGTGGATVAGLLAEHRTEPVLLLEAAPTTARAPRPPGRRHAQRARVRTFARLGPQTRRRTPALGTRRASAFCAVTI